MYLHIYSVCDEMTYGLECALSCGNCSGGKTCHHVNGTCWSDCDTGVHGDRCQHGEYIYRKITFVG